MRTVKIGNAAGFWGDSLEAPRRLAEGVRLDYLTLEYLAELTMSILAHQRARDPETGYVTDFPAVLESLLPSLKSQPGLKIVTNAGGMNAGACARKAAEVLKAAGMHDVLIATLTGDDLGDDVDAHLAAGETFAHFDTEEPFDRVRGRVVSAHAYLGARGIVEALSRGARIVLTGRVADASLAVGPAVYEFGRGWKEAEGRRLKTEGRRRAGSATLQPAGYSLQPIDDWDWLAQATVAGHTIECGAQVTGGMYSDWSPQWPLADVGYPVAELAEDGSFVITKPVGTGGVVNIGTVSEQLVYEIGDPAHYLTPDVDADFSQLTLTEDGPNRVRVAGARGRPRPNRYKVSMSYDDGYKATGTLVVAGPGAVENARQAADVIFERVRLAGFELAETRVECLGAGDSVPGVWPRLNPPEVVLRVSVRDPSHAAVERFTRELAPLVTSGPPGVTGYTGARPKPQPVRAYWPTTIARSRIAETVTVKSVREWLA